MDHVQVFNALEALFWLLLAATAAARGHRTAGFTPGRQLALVVFLAGFALSDVWEIFSGAWWQPRALLVLKAVCLTGLVATAALVFGSRWFGRRASADP